MICSNCFLNYGFSSIVKKYGHKSDNECPTCHTKSGSKVSRENVDLIMETFFVEGSVTPQYLHTLFRVIDVADQNTTGDVFDYKITEDVLHDLNLIRVNFDKTVFNPLVNMAHSWGDTLFRYHIEHNLNKGLKNKNKLNDKIRQVIDRLISCCSEYCIKKNDQLFRIRKNPINPTDHNEYDTPPAKISKNINGRLNNKSLPLFYCSNSPGTCIYESKFDPTDTLILATYKTNQEIVIIDLENQNTGYIDELKDELKEIYNERNISLFLDAITRSQNEYFFLQLISNRAYENKYSGIKYNSFYDRYRTNNSSNIGLFGYPLNSNLLTLQSLNRVVINEVKMKWNYGPALG